MRTWRSDPEIIREVAVHTLGRWKARNLLTIGRAYGQGDACGVDRLRPSCTVGAIDFPRKTGLDCSLSRSGMAGP